MEMALMKAANGSPGSKIRTRRVLRAGTKPSLKFRVSTIRSGVLGVKLPSTSPTPPTK